MLRMLVMLVFAALAAWLLARSIGLMRGGTLISVTLNTAMERIAGTFSVHRGMTFGGETVTLIFAPSGVWVVCELRTDGWLFGSETDEEWVRNDNGDRWNFPNPVIRLHSAAEAVRTAAGLQPAQVREAVVCSGSVTLKTKTKTRVLYPQQLMRLIPAGDAQFSPEELQKLEAVLCSD